MTSRGRGQLEGKVAVITGAARGIGRATLELFVAEGARVVATDLDGAALDETARAVSADVVTVAGDVSAEDDARAMVAAAVSSFGRIDVLVANAGVIPLSTIDQTSVADWDHVMAVDGRGMFLTCKFAIEQMARQNDGRGSGSIVLLSSISGQRGQVGQAAYGPAKYVATGLTHHLAIEWASRGIRVNAVAPGTIRTDAVVALLDTPEGQAYVEEIEGRHPIGRPGRAARGRRGDRLPGLRRGVVRHRRGAGRRRRLPGPVVHSPGLVTVPHRGSHFRTSAVRPPRPAGLVSGRELSCWRGGTVPPVPPRRRSPGRPRPGGSRPLGSSRPGRAGSAEPAAPGRGPTPCLG